MRKLFFSITLIAVGSGMWWLLSRATRHSIKKWDAKFETVLRHNLDSLGLSNQDLLSSVHQMKSDKNGEWVTHRMTVKLPDPAKRDELKRQLENAGANVVEDVTPDKQSRLLVKRGSRVYQEILFQK